VTRPAQRILERARTSAWRRVGIPARWPDKAEPDEAARTSVPATGKNVAGESAEDAGTGRPDRDANSVTNDESGT
jgi:hypothetical protein